MKADEDLIQIIKPAIYHYVLCNIQEQNTEGSIVLTQAALEKLSWVYFVNQKEAMSEDGFEKTKAGDKISLLLFNAGIPLSMPEQLNDLKEYGKKGPLVFSEIRNKLVHPTQKGKKYTGSLFDPWFLGLWYLELVILHFLNYEGKYINRLTYGEGWKTENVPWAVEKIGE